MTKQFVTPVLLISASLVAILYGSGCGEEKKAEEEAPSQPYLTTPQTGDSMSQQIEALKQMEMTVEVVVNGKSVVIWSQKEGSWRWEDPSDKNSYVIYNAQKKKMWVVDGNTAMESTEIQGQQYMGMSPAAMISMYATIPATRRTGDTWELNIPGQGGLTIEFKGPEGLPSKMVITDASTGKTDVTEFRYSHVGSVLSSLFELPSGVSVQQAPAGGGFGGGVTVPTPGGMEGMPGM